MRVVGGRVRGRKLTPFKASGIRPTSDKVREAIFNVLNRNYAGAAVLDIFAGTGAMGIEALSRGATSATFVDNSKGAVAVIKKNLTLCGFEKEGRIINKDARAALSNFKPRRTGEKSRQGRFDLIFIDAPYSEAALTEVTLKQVAESRLLSSEARIVCEVSKKTPIESLPAGLTLIKEKTYGDTLVYFIEAER
ncbi:16S rRNA (guanine(966)-N(2))-methyltransferase [hydrothermal vent metagenome]|uniref:16S rRNA (Guanine(966)-N(2))-methyltransferase n=1 Tax=hydrothermal vent metagenome TaxID=652676 RepID=A0A3B0QKE1_9ZZZZ